MRAVTAVNDSWVPVIGRAGVFFVTALNGNAYRGCVVGRNDASRSFAAKVGVTPRDDSSNRLCSEAFAVCMRSEYPADFRHPFKRGL